MNTQNIHRRRGDTARIPFEIEDSNGDPQNITGATVTLTVNSEERPTDDTNQIFQLSGTITDEANGTGYFIVSEANADNVGQYYYDIQVTDAAGEKETVAEGRFIMLQDRTKT
jgi:hypothetical protein